MLFTQTEFVKTELRLGVRPSWGYVTLAAFISMAS
jgi:hypothetical protein